MHGARRDRNDLHFRELDPNLQWSAGERHGDNKPDERAADRDLQREPHRAGQRRHVPTVVATAQSPGSGSATNTFFISPATAGVSVSGLSAVYNGSQKNVVVTTSPSGLATTITYNGSATAPVNAGSYAVLATINNSNYTGSASGNLVISTAAATVTLSGLSATYNGSAHAVTVTTSPAGLATITTYNGSSTAPINVGSYAVVSTINNSNYTGSASGTLVIMERQRNSGPGQSGADLHRERMRGHGHNDPKRAARQYHLQWE